MDRFIKFHNGYIENSKFHPLIIASRILSSFLHVHPFIDGNGRLGRLIMALYLIRNGYPPIIFQQPITPLQYGVTMYRSQAKKEPKVLYNMVLQNTFNILTKNQD